MINADISGMTDYLSMVDGIVTTVDSDIYINQIMDGMYSALTTGFNATFFAVAKSSPRRYHHVFEWGTLEDGSFPVPLYRVITTGRGRNKIAAFEFLQSHYDVPEPTPASTGIDQEELDKLSGRRYKFKNKAAVMEFGLPVNIRAKHAKKLFIPTAGAEKGFVFANDVVVQQPGGPETKGAFTEYWEMWWDTVAPVLAEEQSKVVEEYIKTAAEATGRTIRVGGSVKSKVLGLKTNPIHAQARFAQLASAAKYRRSHGGDNYDV